MVIGWALRWVLLCCGLVLLGVGMLDRGTALLPVRAVQSGSDARPGAAGERATGPPSNTIVYAANQRGHVILEAAVNGAPVRMLVDTGASLVTLTPQDARAVGIAPSELVYNARANTANGSARMAPVTLREIRTRPAFDLRCSRGRAREPQYLPARHEFSRPAARLRDAGRQAHHYLVDDDRQRAQDLRGVAPTTRSPLWLGQQAD